MQHRISMYRLIIVFGMDNFEFNKHHVIHRLSPDVVCNIDHIIQIFRVGNNKCLPNQLEIKFLSLLKEIEPRRKLTIEFMQVLLRSVYKEPNLPCSVNLKGLNDTGGKF